MIDHLTRIPGQNYRRSFSPFAPVNKSNPSMSSQQQQQQKLQDANAEFNKIQAEMSSIVEARQTLGAQLSENETVQQVHSYSLWHTSSYLCPDVDSRFSFLGDVGVQRPEA